MRSGGRPRRLPADDQHEAGQEHEEGEAGEDQHQEVLLGHTHASRLKCKGYSSPARIPGVTESASVWRGPRFVSALYLAIVALTGVFGFVIGVIRPTDLNPKLFMLIDLPPTPFGVALYGMLTVGIVLGLLLLVVRYVGKEYDPHRVE